MEKRRTCLVINTGATYPTIHKSDYYFELFYKLWGTEFSSYFSAKRGEEIFIPKLTICKVIGAKRSKGQPGHYLISDGKDYAIIGRYGIIIEGEDNNIDFFNVIFKQ